MIFHLSFFYSPEPDRHELMESEDDTLGIPYADPLLYTWDAMVFLVPALLAKVGIKGIPV